MRIGVVHTIHDSTPFTILCTLLVVEVFCICIKVLHVCIAVLRTCDILDLVYVQGCFNLSGNDQHIAGLLLSNFNMSRGSLHSRHEIQLHQNVASARLLGSFGVVNCVKLFLLGFEVKKNHVLDITLKRVDLGDKTIPS